MMFGPAASIADRFRGSQVRPSGSEPTLLVDLHSHSSPRSSCSRATLSDLVESARRRGVDGLCLTEHDVTWPADELAAASRAVDFPLFCGVELTTEIGHVLAIGDLRKPLWLGYRFDELAAEVDESGAAIVLVHPVRNTAGERALRAGRTPPAPEAVAARREWQLVHAVEAGSTQQTETEQALVAAALAVAPRPRVAGSDAHDPDRAGRYATRFTRAIRSSAELAEEIRAGRVEPAFLDPL